MTEAKLIYPYQIKIQNFYYNFLYFQYRKILLYPMHCILAKNEFHLLLQKNIIYIFSGVLLNQYTYPFLSQDHEH